MVLVSRLDELALQAMRAARSGSPFGSPAASALARAHRLAVLKLVAALSAAVLALWRSRRADGRLPDGSSFEDAAAKLVVAYRARIVALAGAYVSAARKEGLGSGLPSGLLRSAPLLLPGRLSRGLGFAGEGVYQRVLSEGFGEARAMQVAEQTLLGTLMRYGFEGSRETVRLTVEGDRRSYGWMRVTDSDPCSFCAMLASRGPVYSTEKDAQWIAGIPGTSYHNACQCVVVARYKDDSTPQADAYRLLWDEATKDLSNDEARKAFRTAFNKARKRTAQAAE